MKYYNFKEHMDDYLLGRLNQKELLLFQKELKKDNDLAQEVDMRRTFIKGVEAFGRHSMKEELKEIHQEVVAVKSLPNTRRRRLLPFIAAASVLLLVFFIYQMTTEKVYNTTDDLYAAYFSPYDFASNQRTAADELDLRIEKLYKSKNYLEVLPLLEEKLILLNPQPSNLLLAQGVAQLETGQAEKAILSFQLISSKDDFNFEDEVNWYSALAYLKTGDLTATRKALQKLIDNPSADHHQSAKKLLSELKSID